MFLLPCVAIPTTISGGGLRNCVYDAYVEAEVAHVCREADGLFVSGDDTFNRQYVRSRCCGPCVGLCSQRYHLRTVVELGGARR